MEKKVWLWMEAEFGVVAGIFAGGLEKKWVVGVVLCW